MVRAVPTHLPAAALYTSLAPLHHATHPPMRVCQLAPDVADLTRVDSLSCATALSHAMARDGSSGGVIRTVVIDKDGATRGFVAGDQLPFSFEVGNDNQD